MRPIAGRGATPMTPKNGRVTGTTTPGATVAVFVWRSIRMMRWKKPGNSSGSAPA
jgi:hypothetical protein